MPTERRDPAAKEEPVAAARALHAERYPEAEVLFLSGSVMRGEATSTSDLDVVVIYPRLENAYRESFMFKGWPVEAFLHDPETLNYFFREVDRVSGVPSLPSMVNDAIEIPGESGLSRSMKQLARSTLAEGPPHWSKTDVDKSRYAITDALDDLVEPRSRAEQSASAQVLFGLLANHFFRTRQLWSAKGKTIPRRMREVDAQFAARFELSFDELFSTGNAGRVIALAEEMLAPAGGRHFEGHTLPAPANWRLPL